MSQEISPGIFFLLFSAYFQSNYVAEASHQQNKWLAHSNNFVLKYFALKMQFTCRKSLFTNIQLS